MKIIKHSDNNRFIINTHAIHNVNRLQQVLGRQLAAPQIPRTPEERLAFHAAISASLRISQAKKRTETNAKRKATLEANKAKRTELAEKQKSNQATAGGSVQDERTDNANGGTNDVGENGGESGSRVDNDHDVSGARKRKRHS